jgi:drug/metabolite transporter (DMT)-like permease
LIPVSPHSGLKQRAAANGYLIIQTMMWGLSFIIIKNVTAAIPVTAFLALRFLAAVILLLPFYVRKVSVAMNPAFFKAALLLASLLFISTSLQTFGLQYTTVTNSSFITGTTVLLVPIFDRLIFKKRLPRVLWLGCAAAFAGVAVLAGNVSLSLNIGDAMTALCAVGFALQILFAAKYALEFPADTIGFFQLALTAVMFTALWGVDGFPLAGFEPRFVAPLLFMAIVNTAIGFMGQFIAYRYTDAVTASLIFALEPLFATGFALVIPGEDGHCETLTLKAAIGALFVLAGLAIALWDSFRQKKTVSPVYEASD